MAGREQLVLVTRNLPPLRGGMERLNAQLARQLAKTFDVTVLGPPGSRRFLDPDILVLECSRSSIGRFLVWSMWKACILSFSKRPRWIVGGSGVVAPVVVVAAALGGAKPAAFLHGLDIVARNIAYRLGWLPAIRRLKLCLVNSHHTATLAESAGVKADRIEVVFPGVEPARMITDEAKALFKSSHGLSGTLLLSVGRLTQRKGLAEFIEHALPAIVERVPNVQLVVIGDDAPDALLKSYAGQRARIDDAVGRLGMGAHVRFLGPVDEDTLATAYGVSDVHVFPVREVSGDVEGFGMVAVEAAAYGLPTVAFAVGGVADAVGEGTSGSLVPAGDYSAFVAAVIRTSEQGRAWYANSSAQFASQLGWDRFGRQVIRALRARETS